jgi:hypothetical protein
MLEEDSAELELPCSPLEEDVNASEEELLPSLDDIAPSELELPCSPPDDKASSELELSCSPLDEEASSKIEDNDELTPSLLELPTSPLLLLARVLHLGPLHFGSRGFSRSKSAQENIVVNIRKQIIGNTFHIL